MSFLTIFVIDILNIKKRGYIFFTSAIIAVCPAMCTTFLYIHASLAYSFAFLFSTLSVWFLYKFKYKKAGIVLSIISILFTLSIYQSYIGVSFGLFAMYNILNILKNNSKTRDNIKNILMFGLTVLVGSVLYYLITKLLLYSNGVTLDSYDGTNVVSLKNIFNNFIFKFYFPYLDFYNFFFTEEVVINSAYKREFLWLICIVIGIVAYVISLIRVFKSNFKDKICNFVICLLLFILLPVFLNAIDIIMGNATLYVLTSASLILIIPFFLAIVEDLFKFNPLRFLSLIISFIIIFTFYIADNVSYTALKLSYNQAYSVAERIIDRIENFEDGRDKPIIIAGAINSENYVRTLNIYDYSLGFVANNTVLHETYDGQLATWNKFLQVYLGHTYYTVSKSEYIKIICSNEFKQMDIYPSSNSIKIINDTVVVKLNENPPLN